MSDDPSSSPSNPTRRVFLKSTSSTAAAAMLGQTVAAHVTEAAELGNAAGKQSASFEIAGAVPISLRINGRSHSLQIDPRTTLLDCIRETVASPERRRAATTGNAARARCM